MFCECVTEKGYMEMGTFVCVLFLLLYSREVGVGEGGGRGPFCHFPCRLRCCMSGSTFVCTLLRCFLFSFVAKRDDGAHKSELGIF